MRYSCAIGAAFCLALGGVLLGSCSSDRDPNAPFTFLNVPSPAGPGSTAPHLALTPSGEVVMSWLEPAGDDRHAVKFATLDGDRWSPSQTVAEGSGWFINWADFPSVAPITTKDWVAHWLVKQPGGTFSYDIALAISRDAGSSWSAPLTPHDDGTRTEHGFVTLFPWGDGFGAVWLDGRNTHQDMGGSKSVQTPGGMTVRYARIGFDGVIREGGEIDDLACDCCATDVAVTAAGPVATWRNRTAEEIRDIAVSRFADGAWQPPVIVGNDQWHMPGCPVNGSTIAARGERVAVAWYTAPNRQSRVQLAWSGDGGRTFSAPVVVEEGAVSGRVDVVLLADDMALVSWTGKTASGAGQIRMRRVPVSGVPGPVQVITEGDVSRSGGFPQMINGRDRLVYVWTQPGERSRVLTAVSPLE